MKLAGLATVAFLASAASAGAQFSGGPISPFRKLVGSWHGFVAQQDIDISPYGDVMDSNGPRSRVRDATFAGANFAFSGRTQAGGAYVCQYYITFLRGGRADWKLVDSRGPYRCPKGVYERT